MVDSKQDTEDSRKEKAKRFEDLEVWKKSHELARVATSLAGGLLRYNEQACPELTRRDSLPTQIFERSLRKEGT
ncbi:MAG TPA: hypothetical protein VGA95_14780 [Thermodesulfobacteriota bacterium]